jgi:hypothetical protein
MSGATHIRLQYLPSPTARAWRDSSLSMWKEGRENMEKTAAALQLQNGWHAWQIVEFKP